MFERSRPSILHYKFELYFNVIKIITQVRGKISNQALDWLFLRFLPFRPDRAWALVSLSSSWICLTWPWAQARVVTLVCFIQTPFRPISCLSTSLHPIRQNHETSSDAFQRFWKKKIHSEIWSPLSKFHPAFWSSMSFRGFTLFWIKISFPVIGQILIRQ